MPVSATGSNTPSNHFGGSFGTNEWLVDEMYQRFLVDPNSVDKAWHEFFADYITPSNSPVASAPLVDAPRGGTPPVPKSVLKSEIQSAITTPATNDAPF